MPTNISGVYGTDGLTPQYDPTAGFRIWRIDEIYMGGVGLNKHVPKINDLVVEFPPLVYKQVIAIDETTLIPDLVRVVIDENNGQFEEGDSLLAVGPGAPSDTFRVYLDKSVIPYSMAVDGSVMIGGSRFTHARVFRGVDLNENTGEIVSLVYDSLGNVVGNSIPLELVGLSGNIATKTVPPFQTMKNLPDNEIVTLVVYTDTGHVGYKRQLKVENTSYIRRASSSTKYVTHISLKCPFLASNDATLINLPVNVPLNGLNLIGVVHYSDGSSIEYPVDGTRFALIGMNNFIATQVGQELNTLVLRLQLLQNEVSYDTTQFNEGYMTRNFRIVTTAPDGAYNIKLYCVPTWQDTVHGYRLRWYMYNLDRQVTQEVTNFVTYSPESAIFNPIGYGISQNLVVAINLKDISASNVDYRYVQSIAISLRGPGTARTTNWSIAYVNGQNPEYGIDTHVNLKFINVNLYEIAFGSGFATQSEWLNKLYWNGKPLYNPQTEGSAPTPNFFILVVGNQEYEYDISEWNTTTQIPNGLDVNGTAVIKFIRRTQTTDLQLGLAALPIYELA